MIVDKILPIRYESKDMMMAKKNIDWAHLSFGYIPTDSRYVSYWKNGQWDDGQMVNDSTVTINESAGVLQYAQTCFEGLKAYTTEDGRVVLFRPDMNARRLMDSCDRLLMPSFPVERFLDAIDKLVIANQDYVPPYGSGASLYIRPYIFGSGPILGVAPASEYTFRVFCSPVGPYFKGGMKPLRLMVSNFDRAAPRGSGHIKGGLNYAMSLYAGHVAHEAGYSENLYLDSTRTYIEETGGANFIFVTKDGTLVTPKSPTILPSITRRSLMQVAKDYLHMETEERPVKLTELKNFAEAGLCGTAAVISPVGTIHTHDGDITFGDGISVGPVVTKLYDTLTGIQMGRLSAPGGWIHQVI
ncbi:branched-chain amino acid aminotransferase [Parasphaerochaeta coccoides]|uniref:branched-chain-amino-acid transaminase n=1 Tax=Parasphaerochaeta coccoides (strain ATCC BAA-1237 / DSM 17374 / SPN1) TaxID=760011 RepID=F4GJS0_PARC1|nr:branched-chain amino acid aminotransferase [Parasphaerochaeta coccoides]AEC02817.1 branched-chain amino acid aminotransferase [Parasphaerochaeta coccoides DSM 17374]